MKYTYICDAPTKEECIARFEKLLLHISREFGGTPEDHRTQQLSNVGYFTGYYSAETAARVQGWLGCSHPIFGRTRPTVQEALDAGKRAATEVSS